MCMKTKKMAGKMSTYFAQLWCSLQVFRAILAKLGRNCDVLEPKFTSIRRVEGIVPFDEIAREASSADRFSRYVALNLDCSESHGRRGKAADLPNALRLRPSGRGGRTPFGPTSAFCLLLTDFRLRRPQPYALQGLLRSALRRPDAVRDADPRVSISRKVQSGQVL